MIILCRFIPTNIFLKDQSSVCVFLNVVNSVVIYIYIYIHTVKCIISFKTLEALLLKDRKVVYILVIIYIALIVKV